MSSAHPSTPSHPSHSNELIRLRRIEGQVRGVQKMIEERRYCVDILTQLSSISAALARVKERILERHLRSCARESLAGKNRDDQSEKIEEIIRLLARFRRAAGA
ncbi:MAG: metal-sensitive transcriptional regulator [Candidatus Aminicenantes bacterium]|nr:metal-sensitive transcriptional regulator [Candidatus Aminicenantes bacterium]